MIGAAASPPTGNAILRGLRLESLDYLHPHLERVHLPSKTTLNEAQSLPDHVYFPEGGVLSFAFYLPSGKIAEFGVVGNEGLSSFSALRIGQASPVRTVVQVGGYTALRIETPRLREAFRACEDLREQVYGFLYAFMGQMAYTAVSNGCHTLPARLARWLLLCDDRLDGGDIPVTHEFFASILTAQRTSVTAALHLLEGQHAIRNTRKLVQITDRRRLEDLAGEAYIRYGEAALRP